VIKPGQVVRFKATFRTYLGVLTTPTTATIKLLEPGGTEASYVYGTDPEVTLESVGVLVLREQLWTVGSWHCRAEGTGVVAAVDELDRAVEVSTSPFASAVPPVAP
jgi:hypothetical protein